MQSNGHRQQILLLELVILNLRTLLGVARLKEKKSIGETGDP